MKQSQIKKLLPWVYQRTAQPGNPLAALLEVMQDLHAPVEATIGRLDSMFDPRRTSDGFVSYLAGWVDLGVLIDMSRGGGPAASKTFPTGLGRLRELIASAAMLSEWRGTKKGLQMFLEIATGASGFSIDEQVRGPDGSVMPFHLQVTAPKDLVMHRSLLERIIELEKPAYVTYQLSFQD
ncbi:MAG TPA: phage tail protein [Terracidiphilus sp.]